jgi:hypothetical protein
VDLLEVHHFKKRRRGRREVMLRRHAAFAHPRIVAGGPSLAMASITRTISPSAARRTTHLGAMAGALTVGDCRVYQISCQFSTGTWLVTIVDRVA